MKRLSQLLLMVALSNFLNTAAAQSVNLTGNWAGIATPNGPNFQPTGPQPVSASITQTANSITATLVFVDGEGIPQIFTGTGQINGTSISSSDNDTVVAGNISSSNGLLQMSGSGKDDTMVQFTGSFSSNGQHMSGMAISSQGDTVTWSLDKLTAPQVTGLSAVVGHSSVYLRWVPVPIKVDTFVVDIKQQSGNTFIPLGTVFCDPRNSLNAGVQQDPSCLITALPNGSSITDGITYRFTVTAKSGGVLGLPSDPVFAAAGGFSGANKPKPTDRVLFLHGFLGDGRVNGTFTDTLHFMTKTLGWTYGGQLYHCGNDLTVTHLDLQGTTIPSDQSACLQSNIGSVGNADFFSASFGSNTASYSDRKGLTHQGDEVRNFVRKLNATGFARSIDVVAHSNGGLAARSYIELSPSEADASLSRLVTYGTPHLGADLGIVPGIFGLSVPILPLVNELLHLDILPDGANQAAFGCFGQTIVLSDFLFGLDTKLLLQHHIAYTSIIGQISSDRAAFDDCHSKHWDGLVPVTSANLNNVGSGSLTKPVATLTTNHVHIGQGNDFPTILCALDPNCTMFRVLSPVDIEVTAPDGRVIAHDLAAIPGASYMNIKDSTGHETATVVIPFPLGGDYTIKVVPKPGVSPTDTYTLEVTRAGVTTTVVRDQRVQDIPAQPYVIPVLSLAIDIKPGGLPNSINVTSQGTMPVAILSTPSFNATNRVDTTSLTFGHFGDEASLAFCNSKPEDVNSDSLPDLVCHFRTQQTGFLVGDSQGVLKGTTVDGVPFVGTDSVRIVK